VRGWFGKSRNHQLSESQYREFGARLTSFRWPGDPPDPPDSPWLIKEPEPDPDRWWDFDGAFDAANLLIKSAPAMTSHWRKLEWAPETRGGTQAIETLEKALVAALPYIEFPFGTYPRQTGRKKPKPWHIVAVMIAHHVIKALSDAGQANPAISRNSVAARVVQRALIRMGFVRVLQVSTVAQQLVRWDRQYGLRLKTIIALTKKHEADICALLTKPSKVQSPST
jgi:hypothetical protein